MGYAKRHRNNKLARDEREIRMLARTIPNETELRRILSNERDPMMRLAVLQKMQPYLSFDISNMFHN
jgi:hypothetical protein